MDCFDRLYQLRGRLELEGERLEFMLGDGRLRWSVDGRLIDHPVLLQRVELEFDPTIPEFRINDADRPPELYTALLHGIAELGGERVIELQLELDRGAYHPLAQQGTDGFLRRLSALISPRGVFQDEPAEGLLPADPIVCRDPVLFVRSRAFGMPAALDYVLADLDGSPELPPAIQRVIGIEPPSPPSEAYVAASPWSEPPEVLLSKPANAEQIQLARALEKHRAVLVQGPPGTGKSHTIANLIGHLVAQGKRVLVTAHTAKALRVLRNQVVEPLRPLCVAVLDNDLESRGQLEQAVRGVVSRLTTDTEDALSADIRGWSEARDTLLSEVEQLTAQLRTTREGEYVPIVFDGASTTPSEAAREVAQATGKWSWLPGPVEPGAPLPLSEGELHELYLTNHQLTQTEEQELAEPLPSESDLPSAEQFAADVSALDADEPARWSRLWDRPPEIQALTELERLRALIEDVSTGLEAIAPWQLALVAAGYTGSSESELWRVLADQVGTAFRVWQEGRELLLEHSPEVDTSSGDDLKRVIEEMLVHLESGAGFGRFTLLRRRRWRRVLDTCRVNGQSPTTPEHFSALLNLLEIEQRRQKLARRWGRQAVPIGLPRFDAMPDPVEPAAHEYAVQFGRYLGWWEQRWEPVRAVMRSVGFDWDGLRATETTLGGPMGPFDKDRQLLAGPLFEAVTARVNTTRSRAAEDRVLKLATSLRGYGGPACTTLRRAVDRRDVPGYRTALDRIIELGRKAALRERRIALLSQLETAAPAWAGAVRNRLSPHDAARPPEGTRAAWRWRQLHDELERRAALDDVALTRRLEARHGELRAATVTLIDRMAWLAQLRRTDLRARQALHGWLDTHKKIGKGKGKRVPELQAQARRLLDQAREAVPVWIMPLPRVAESFDPRKGRFDVVIVDEASQADVTGLLAWYLGDRTAIVGDDEQVSPLAVGQSVDDARALISEHLHGIPNSHLYDGKTSIYDLAKQSFGGTIGLREHFRCVPDIIEFSNHLSYQGQIRPLRDPASAPLPHVVEYIVPAELGVRREGKVNLAEARVIAALVKAACERPEYQGKTMGAITLLGDEQAYQIQELVISLVGAVDLERRRFVAGNSAQYQGDERNIIWLSMVEVPVGTPLRFVDSQPIKQRFNVAASRAKDQLWVVHSLDPGRDLKEGDLRRRLIEHARDPGLRRRALETALARAESHFEREVIRHLVTMGYRVRSQVEVGYYSIDIVVSEGQRHAAIECDGDRFHPIEKIPEDMARQAVLERAGWRFVRIRGSRFYRDWENTMDWVVSELDRLGVGPVGPEPETAAELDTAGRALRDQVVRRAWEIMREQDWVATPEHDSADSSNPSRAEGLLG